MNSRGGGIFLDNNNNNASVKSINLTKMIGRGSELQQTSTESFKPPDKNDKTIVRKTKNGGLKITKVEDKTKKNEKKEAMEVEENGMINWDYLEKGRKYKPCVKLLKNLTKGKKKSTKKNNSKKLGRLFFNELMKH